MTSGIEPYRGEPDIRRLLAALRGERTDRVPHIEILIEDQHVEALLGRKAGNTLGVGGDPAKGSAAAEGVRPMHPEDYLELVYWIRRGGYQGWLTLDIFPYREDGVRAATQCKKWMESFFQCIDRVGMDACAEVIRKADGCDAVDLVRRALCG